MNEKIIIIFKFWLPVFVWMGFIFWTSSVPGEEIPTLFWLQDIVFHLFVYLILGLIFSRALKNTYLEISALKMILFTVTFVSLYGTFNELYQAFIPERNVSIYDIFINGLGSFMGSLFYPVRTYRAARKKKGVSNGVYR